MMIDSGGDVAACFHAEEAYEPVGKGDFCTGAINRRGLAGNDVDFPCFCRPRQPVGYATKGDDCSWFEAQLFREPRALCLQPSRSFGGKFLCGRKISIFWRSDHSFARFGV